MTGQGSAHCVRLARAFLRGPPHDFTGSRVAPAKDLTLRGALLIILFWLVGHSQTASAGQIYWAEPTLGKIMRANDDGTHVEQVIVGSGAGGTLAIDIEGRKLYWTGCVLGCGIHRSNLDGTGIEKILDVSGVEGLTVDHQFARIFWFDGPSENIFTANLDGSDVRIQFGSQTDLSRSLAVDPVGGCLYLTQGDGVKRGAVIGGASCDPSDVVSRFPDALTRRIALDVSNERLYWSEDENVIFPADGFGSIRRIGFDGTNMETIIASPLDPETRFRVFGIATDSVGERVYWTELAGDNARIRRANLDGTSIEDLQIAGLSFPDTIVFDPIPEPASIVLAAIAIVVLGAARICFKHRRAAA